MRTFASWGGPWRAAVAAAAAVALAASAPCIAGDPAFAIAKTVVLRGLGSDRASDLALDADGNAYVAGVVDAHDFPGLDSARFANAGNAMRFVARVDARSRVPAFVTVVGSPTPDVRDARVPGASRDDATGLALDRAGNAFLVAYGGTPTFPATGGAYQPATAGKFVFRVGAAGDVARWSATLDPAIRRVGAIAVDAAGNVYLTGSARDGLVTSAGAPFAAASVAPGCMAPYVVKLDATGQAVAWATYLGTAGVAGARCGGAGVDGIHDPGGYALAVDGNGNVYVTGQAEPGLAATPGALNVAPTDAIVHAARSPSYATASHAFVAKLDAAGRLAWAARIGGNDHDRGTSVAVDAAGYVVVAGKTAATAIAHAGGFGDVAPYATRKCLIASPEVGFVAKLAPDGSRLAYFGFVPAYGTQLDQCRASGAPVPLRVLADETGDAVVVGTTSPYDREVDASGNALEPVAAGYGLLFVVAADGRTVRYATTFAGEGAQDARRDRWGNLVTVDAVATLRVLAPQAVPIAVDVAPDPACAGQPVTIEARLAASFDLGSVTFFADGTRVGSAFVADGTARVATTLGAGVRRLTAAYAGAGLFDGYASPIRYVAVEQAGACP